MIPMTDQTDADLHDLGLLESEGSDPFDKLTRLASEMIGAPVTLVSIVMPAEDRQYFKSMFGLPEPWRSLRQTPMSHSFCKHVRATDRPLIVADARESPLLAQNGAIADLGVIAYAGFPIHGPYDQPIGAFCAIDTVPREWSQEHSRIIADFASIADDQIRLLSAIRERNRALAAEREANAARTRIFNTVSHEVRTPLAGVLGMADLLLDRLEDPESRIMVDTIREAGKSLLRLQTDFLDMAKAEAGKIRLENEAFDLPDLLRTVHRLHAASATGRPVKVDLQLAEDLPKVVRGDPYRLQQVLNNIVANAVKFTESGHVTLSAAARADQPGVLQLRIQDSGIGMTEDELSRLFVPFEQGTTRTTRAYGGTGLGMAITARLVTLMKGRIEVDSVPGIGTDFTLTLRLPAVDLAPTPPVGSLDSDAQDRQARERPLDGMTFLVADDNATNRALIRAFLGKVGATCIMVTNGAEAVERARVSRFDAILLDINMPVMDGIDALARIRSLAGVTEQSRVPAIAITANASEDDRAAYTATGFAGVVTKPFTVVSLTAALLSALRKPVCV